MRGASAGLMRGVGLAECAGTKRDMAGTITHGRERHVSRFFSYRYAPEKNTSRMLAGDIRYRS
jgi:hypothetical protein